jgi:2-iminobutanoate/2-iminopropanoate deaminase
MDKQPVTTDTAPRPGGPYSQGIRAGEFLFVAGQGPTDPRTGQRAGDDIQTQTRQTLENVKAIVEAAGGSLSGAVKVNVYLSDLANFGAMNAIYREYFPEPFPVRTTVGTALLGILVEIDAIVYMGG